MKTIAYLVYGSRREYQLELTYSVLSAIHFIGRQPSNYRVVLITDQGNERPDLPIEHLTFSRQEFNSWTRSGTYMHKAKVHALMKAMDHFKGSVALIDTDTYFLDHPDRLFQRIGPGKSVMHASEGNLRQYEFWNPLLERVTAPIAGYDVTGESKMINSGVVGVDFADRHLLDEVVPLIDSLYDIHPIFNIEQFAFAAVLSEHTQVSVCPDVVYHYWGCERGFLHSQIEHLFPTFSSELFYRYVDAIPRLGYPKKQRSDQFKAMIVGLLRHHGNEYRFAYIAYLSALTLSTSDPPNASVWAGIALTMLEKNSFPAKHVVRDFAKMKNALDFSWLASKTRQDWIRYWERIARPGKLADQ